MLSVAERNGWEGEIASRVSIDDFSALLKLSKLDNVSVFKRISYVEGFRKFCLKR